MRNELHQNANNDCFNLASMLHQIRRLQECLYLHQNCGKNACQNIYFGSGYNPGNAHIKFPIK
jgi:hypothetical protein